LIVYKLLNFPTLSTIMSLCSNYSNTLEFIRVCEVAKKHVFNILGIEDCNASCRTYTCPEYPIKKLFEFYLPELKEAVGSDHPLYVALTQQDFKDFRRGIEDYDTLADRLSFICGMHERLGQNSCVSMLGDDVVRLILARAFGH